jgi:hypothetical protein
MPTSVLSPPPGLTDAIVASLSRWYFDWRCDRSFGGVR